MSCSLAVEICITTLKVLLSGRYTQISDKKPVFYKYTILRLGHIAKVFAKQNKLKNSCVASVAIGLFV